MNRTSRAGASDDFPLCNCVFYRHPQKVHRVRAWGAGMECGHGVDYRGVALVDLDLDQRRVGAAY